MKRNQKTSVITRVVNAPTEKAEAKNLSIVKTSEIEEAQIVEPTKEQQPIKPNLMETMKIIDELHQKTRHRNKLEVYSDLLGRFSIEQKKEDLLEKNYYSGCSLVITDDKRDNFELRHPVLIGEVVEFLKSKFNVKLAEIEAEIILP